ncbi:Ycf48-like protein [Streptomyces sp. MBT84]|uniref:F510_1955 family glycosylhydrolase n=1 Tax=Streptomyces sp. MBT84 TaxID=1488414 RepID=UPI001C6E142E|nr:exo-alpha-sialidase [Streptomyces sp. MBT84]MBW8705517.1 Ycf48-like protein [Streptomyces sp. MBT84]
MKKHHAASAVTAVSLLLALAACSSSDADGNTASDSSSATAISHIHGLGLNPSDGRLYVATHEGIYTPDAEGRPKLIGDSTDGFMGFTVTNDGTFYASGHPAQEADGPGNKGLIKSTDAGKTWTTVSLTGQSDFHALDYAHATFYAYDSTNGLLRTSKDGTMRKNGATLQALDIAASPGDPNLVLATTAEGVARSSDGGKTFAQGKEPVLAFLSWSTKDSLYGIDTSGGLLRSSDGGVSWNKVATVPGGQPQALSVIDAGHVLAATQGGVYESKDGGRTFTERLAVESANGR